VKNALRVILRQVLVWWLPCIVGLVVMLAVFLSWALGTQAGASFLLHTAAAQFDGEVQDVRGSVLNGLSIGKLRLPLPDLTLDIEGLRVQAAWRALSLRTVHLRELSLDVLRVAWSEPIRKREDENAGRADDLAPLPVKVVVDRLALGRFTLTRNGEPLPVSLGELAAGGRWDKTGLSLTLNSLAVGHDPSQTRVRLSGTAQLAKLAAPWPLRATLAAAVRGGGPDSPVCAVQRLPGVADGKHGAPCAFQASLNADGSLTNMALTLRAEGGGLTAQAGAELDMSAGLPVRRASLDLSLANGSGLAVSLQPESLRPESMDATDGSPLRERLSGVLSARRFDAGALLVGAIPSAVLTAEGRFTLEALARNTLTHADVALDIAPGSAWNGQPLSGRLAVRATGNGSVNWDRLRVTRLDMDVSLGKNRIQSQGGFGEPTSKLTLSVQTPRLADIWPGLSGGLSVQGRLGGSMARHEAELQARYTPSTAASQALGGAPVNVKLSFAGAWRDGWHGRLRSLHVAHAGFEAIASQPIAFDWERSAPSSWQWRAGAGELTVSLPGLPMLQIVHQGSRGSSGRWESAGAINDLQLSRALVREVRKLMDPGYQPSSQQGGVRTPSSAQNHRSIGLDLAWDLRFDGALAGTATAARRSGDLRIPGDPPTPLGLRDLALSLHATPTRDNVSRIDLALAVATEKMGRINGAATTMLQGLTFDPKQTIRAALNANIDDLRWVASLTGDGLDIGGRLHARIEGQGTLGGAWRSTGVIQGDTLRIVRIDDGVRLFDGTLAMRLDNDRVVLESLRFPAVPRITPSEDRTRAWIADAPEAQNGELRASGDWNLTTMVGGVQVVLHRFPIVQRADRYAMMSGQIDLLATLPSVRITGGLTADAGWVNPDMMSSVPTLDDDVSVRRADIQTPSGMDVGMNLTVDLGPRFYLTGMGIDTGLTGRLRVMLDHKRLTGQGIFRTRDGRFEAYGQRLDVRRGVIIFHDKLANPRLDIEALRLGEQVEAGVRIVGTAQRPRIDLVSYPDVNDVDKLSWLILGRGADQSGSDAALLISLGTSLFGGGEPFYRRFGLDDVGIKSGVMGSSGSLLPDATVAGSVARASNAELETQFMVASKRFANRITLSIEQALAGAQTVGRASYQLARGLSIDIKGGSVNGLALVYRTFWGN